VFLSSAVKSIGRDHETFGRFLSQVAKHHLLAVFSTVRLHHIQAMMNLRQVLEHGACAAFAIANPDPAHFASITAEGTLDASKKLTDKRYKWLDKQFPKGSSQIKEMKEMINNSTAHANIAYTNQNLIQYVFPQRGRVLREMRSPYGFKSRDFDYRPFLWCE
jgi:hypothetical protein